MKHWIGQNKIQALKPILILIKMNEMQKPNKIDDLPEQNKPKSINNETIKASSQTSKSTDGNKLNFVIKKNGATLPTINIRAKANQMLFKRTQF